MSIDFYEGQRQVHSWGARILAFVHSSVFLRLLTSGTVLFLYLCVAQFIMFKLDWSLNIEISDVKILGAIISMLIVLRTNSAYERWWEARKLWGQLVNESRNLALKIRTMVDSGDQDLELAQEYIASFPLCLRDHLRDGLQETTLAALPEPLPESVTHVPAYVAGKLFAILKRWKSKGQLDRLDHHLIDQHVKALMDICGACERILNTPLPLSHRALIPQLLAIYLIIVPLAVDLDVAYALIGMGACYFLLGLELIAEEIEEPFGEGTDDLPLDTLANNIGRSVREIFASDFTPGPLLKEDTEAPLPTV